MVLSCQLQSYTTQWCIFSNLPYCQFQGDAIDSLCVSNLQDPNYGMDLVYHPATDIVKGPLVSLCELSPAYLCTRLDGVQAIAVWCIDPASHLNIKCYWLVRMCYICNPISDYSHEYTDQHNSGVRGITSINWICAFTHN